MKMFTALNRFVLLLALTTGFSTHAAPETNAPAPATARELFNAGTALLSAKKFDDAEKIFQSALATKDEQIQPKALYNIGHTRFASGLDRLTKGPDAQKTAARGNSALTEANHALTSGESALAENNMEKMINAYLEGRGARHDLKEAQKAVSSAMENYGKTMEQWLRADGDFKGAAELNPADTNALYNAKIVEQAIAKLVDTLRQMQEMAGMMGQKKQDLGKMLAKLKGQIPAANAPPGAAGDEDDDDDGKKPGDLAGQKENEGRDGDQMKFNLSPDQASQILNGLSLDGTRRLDMSDKQGAPAKDRQGRNW